MDFFSCRNSKLAVLVMMYYLLVRYEKRVANGRVVSPAGSIKPLKPTASDVMTHW